MAKWGEGDPRWIVEERADATNVNNWHWTEKNATGWSKDKIKSLLEGLKLENEEYICEIKEITTLEGEASANNRKAKLIFFYEWLIKADWTGEVLSSGKTYKGNLEIPNLSEENDADELDVQITVTSDVDEAYRMKEYFRKNGTTLVQQQLGNYISELKTKFSEGMILNKDGVPQGKENSPQVKTSTQNDAKKAMSQPVVNSSVPTLGVKIKCKKLTDYQEFKCPPEQLYRALTDREMVLAFTRGSVAVYEAEKGGRFSLFGDNVTGEFVELVSNQKIKMRWRFKTWPDAHYSTATIDLEPKETFTSLSLTQTGVPESDYDRTKEGWIAYYWQSIRQTFGFGANLY